MAPAFADTFDALIPANLDSWRSSLAFKSRRKNETEGVISSRFQVPDERKHITCMAASNVDSFIALGSGSKESNLFLMEDRVDKASRTGGGGGKEPGRTLNHISTFTNPSPIYSVAWSGDTILAGCSDGMVNHFQIDYNALKSGQKAGGLKCTVQYAHRVKNVMASPPGSFVYTSRVQRVEFAALPTTNSVSTPSQFLSLVGASLHIWDTANSEAPVRSDKVAHEPNMAAAWSPHAPYALIALGGIDKAVAVCDPRKTGKPMVWKARSAHADVIRDVQWNPFVPYWIASSGDDNVVHIWDIRSNVGPVARIEGHYNSVQSIAWSNTHADIISTGSGDRSWRLWNLRSGILAQVPSDTSSAPANMEPTGVGTVVVGAEPIADRKEGYAGSVCSVISSHLLPNVFYAVSFMGDIYSHTISSELVDQLTIHSYDSKRNPLESEVERAVHARDISAAYSALLKWTRNPENVGRTKETLELIDLCRQSPPIDPTTWSFASPTRRAVSQRELNRHASSAASLVDTTVKTFRQDLDKWSRAVPPGIQAKFTKQAEASLVSEVETLMLKLDVREMLAKGEWEEILKHEKVICTCLDSSGSTFDPITLKEVVEAILPHNAPRALQLGLRFAEISETRRRFSDMAPLIRRLLYPTLFDPVPDPPGDPKSSNTAILAVPGKNTDGFALGGSDDGLAVPTISIKGSVSPTTGRRPGKKDPFDKVVQNPQLVLAMIKLEISLSKITSKGGESADDEIIFTMHNQHTISQKANKLYLDALVNARRYDDYLITAMELMGTYAPYDFARQLLTQTSTVVSPRLKKHLEIITFTVQREPLGLETNVYRETLIMMARIAQHCGGDVPGFDRTVLQDSFKQISSGFFMLLGSPTSQNANHQETAREAQAIVKTITEGFETRKSKFMAEEINNLVEKVQRHCRM